MSMVCLSEAYPFLSATTFTMSLSGSICRPRSVTISPFTDTLPAKIDSSVSRRESIPCSLKYFCMRMMAGRNTVSLNADQYRKRAKKTHKGEQQADEEPMQRPIFAHGYKPFFKITQKIIDRTINSTKRIGCRVAKTDR